MALAANERCDPPLDDDEVRGQVEGAVPWVAKQEENDTAAKTAAAFLEEMLEGRRSRPAPGRRRCLRVAGSCAAARPRRSRRAPVEWLIPNVVPLGTLSLVAGVGGLGKSALMLAWAAEVTRGGANVLIVSYEDAAEQVIRPRFEALGGDLDRLFELYVDPLDGSVSFPTDLAELDRHVRETQARLVVIDPVSASIDLKLDAHKDQDVRVVLGQLAQLAEQRLAVVMNAHLNKAPSADPYLRINGSTAFYNASRERAHRHARPGRGLAPAGRAPQVELRAAGPGRALAARDRRGAVRDRADRGRRMEFVEIADDVSRDDVLAPPVAGEALRGRGADRRRARAGPPALVRGEGGRREGGDLAGAR